MSWFRRSEPPPPQPEGDDWIVVPFRLAEAARVSLYTIGSSPRVSDEVRWWIAEWLAGYNHELVYYMRHMYGQGIFDTLDRITQEVMPPEDSAQGKTEPSWDRWESELEDGGK